MRKRGKLLRKSGALVLALALTVSPLWAMAADVQEIQEDSTQTLETVTTSDEVDTAETISETEEQVANHVEGEEIPEVDDVSGEAELNVSEEPDAAPAAEGQYDTTAPVIEEVIFEQNGQTLTQEDVLKISVRAYDADSTIESAVVEVQFSDGYAGNPCFYEQIKLVQSASDLKLFEGTLPIKGTAYDSGIITRIDVVDTYNNKANYETRDNNTGDYKYKFKVVPKDPIDVSITNVQFDNPGATLKVNESVSFRFKLNSDVDFKEKQLSANFRHESNERSTQIGVFFSETDGLYKGTFDVYEGMVAGKWFFEGFTYFERGKHIAIKSDLTENIWYNVETVIDNEKPEILSIEVDKNGQILQPGDVAKFTVKASDNIALDTYGYIGIEPAVENVSSDDSMIYLDYNAAIGAYEGTFQVKEETYPCEWYISFVEIFDKAGNSQSYQSMHFWEENFPYYFRVKNGNTFVNPTCDVTISFSALDASGEWKEINSVTKENVERRTTLKELGIETPKPAEYKGLSFQGWSDYSGGTIDENTMILEDGYIAAEAVYDKCPVTIRYFYYDKDGYTVIDTETCIVPKDTLIKDVGLEAKKKEIPYLYEGMEFQEWIYSLYNWDDFTTVGNRCHIDFKAKYDKTMIRFLVEDVFVNESRPETGNAEIVYCKAAKPGEKVNIPVSSEKYGVYTWRESNGNLTPEEKELGYIVAEDNWLGRNIWGYGSKTGTDQPEEPDNPDIDKPEEPDKPVDPGKPEEPDQPEVPSTPEGVELPEESVQEIVEELEQVEENTSYTIDMGDATVVPKDVLETVKGKDVEVKLDMGGYTWTINGTDIAASDLQNINLEVKLNTEAIPSETVKELAGENPTKQLSLTHEGDFGFQATLTLNAGSEYAGKTGSLYWYDSSNKLVFVDSGIIQENGEVSLKFSHASDYVLVMEDKVTEDNGTDTGNNNETNTDNNNGDGNTGNNNGGDNTDKNNSGDNTDKNNSGAADKDNTDAGNKTAQKSVKTGDDTSLLMIFALLLASAATVGVVLYRRKAR